MSVREVGRFLGVNHQTAANWIEAASAQAEATKASGAVADNLLSHVAARRKMVLQEREWRRWHESTTRSRSTSRVKVASRLTFLRVS
jgi:hypothetical protein